MTHLPVELSGTGSVPALIVPIFGEADSLAHKAASAASKGATMVEWRADLSPNWEAGIDALRDSPLPVIATIRTDREGGEYAGTGVDYGQAVLSLARGPFVALDVEINRSAAPSIIPVLHDMGLPVIASHHNFNETPRNDDIMETIRVMEEMEADVFKIAFMPTNPDDTWRQMDLSRKLKGQFGVPIISISMGAEAAWTRVAAGALGSVATFAALDAGSAPGQIDVSLMRDVLRSLGG